MRIIERLEDFAFSSYPLVLTIGNFDGMHRGHQALFQRARSLAGSEGLITAMTFRNHPSEILRPLHVPPLLQTLAHKLSLLEQTGIECLTLLPFTRYLAEHSAASFIERVRQSIPFSHLVLGHDATLGRDRQGDKATMDALSEQWGFSLHYLEEYRFEGQVVSSSRIRKALQEGNLEAVEQLLGRPYSLYGMMMKKQEKEKIAVYLDVKGLCLPPLGVYAIEGKSKDSNMEGIAKLQIPKIPQLEETPFPVLEIHFLNKKEIKETECIELIFKKLIDDPLV